MYLHRERPCFAYQPSNNWALSSNRFRQTVFCQQTNRGKMGRIWHTKLSSILKQQFHTPVLFLENFYSRLSRLLFDLLSHIRWRRVSPQKTPGQAIINDTQLHSLLTYWGYVSVALSHRFVTRSLINWDHTYMTRDNAHKMAIALSITATRVLRNKEHIISKHDSRKSVLTGLMMMTSSNGNIFRVTGHLCGEFTGHRWIPLTKASDGELWCFFDLRLE